MTIRNLNFLFAPSSVALIGASGTPGTVAGVLTTNVFNGGFKGQLFAVNPQEKTIAGVTTYPDIAALLQPPELAVIVTQPETVPELISELGKKGTKATIVISCGFAANTEPHSQRLRSAMLAAAQPYLLRILGPDCLGVMVPGVGLNAGYGHIQPLPGNLAFVSQSGAILTTVLDWATPRKIGFSHCVSLGEMADVDFGDMIDYLAHDYATRAILLYMENITSARKFMSAARAAARNKPVIVVKAGRHIEENIRAAASHTGFSAGSDAVYDAVFRRSGILRVRDLQALFDAVQTLSMTRQVAGDRLAIVTNGGGIGVMAADTLIDRDGRLAVMEQATIDSLNQVLPSTWSHTNPVNIISDVPDNRYGEVLKILDKDRETDAILVLHCPTALASSTEAAQAVIKTQAARKSTFRQKALLTCWLGDGSVLDARRMFTENNIPTYATPTEAVRGFMQIVRYRKSQEILMQTPPSMAETFTPDTIQARDLVADALAENRSWLTPSETRTLLTAYAIPFVDSSSATSPGAAAELAEKIGEPTVLNQPMIHRPYAHELAIGMVNDALFGPVLMVGHGGAAAEVIEDNALALPPLNMLLALDTLAQTRMYKLLQGYPGRVRTDLKSIALTLIKVSQLICDIAEIAELTINPLLADEHGVLVLGARVKLVKAEGTPFDRLVILPYPKELEESLRLPDGQTLLIRPIRPEDEPNFQKIFAGLTPEEIRLRFLHPMNTMPHSLAARLTQIDYDREMSLVVEGKSSAGETELYGVVQISADPDKERAEFAILLLHNMTGLGLGPMLLRRIIDYARGQGIGEIFGEVLNDNRSMLKLCRVFGFTVKSDREDPEIMQVCLKL